MQSSATAAEFCCCCRVLLLLPLQRTAAAAAAESCCCCCIVLWLPQIAVAAECGCRCWEQKLLGCCSGCERVPCLLEGQDGHQVRHRQHRVRAYPHHLHPSRQNRHPQKRDLPPRPAPAQVSSCQSRHRPPPAPQATQATIRSARLNGRVRPCLGRGCLAPLRRPPLPNPPPLRAATGGHRQPAARGRGGLCEGDPGLPHLARRHRQRNRHARVHQETAAGRCASRVRDG
jgi:hypothetical protein